MKRIAFVLLCIILVAGAAAGWWVFRDTPEKVLRDGFMRMLTAKTFGSVVLDVAWTDPSTRVTTGFGAAGRMSTADLTRPEFLGVVRTGEGLLGKETAANLIVSQDAIALHPREVTEELTNRYQSLIAGATGTPFILLDRNVFLERGNYRNAVPKGKDADVRAILALASPVIVPTGAWTKEGDTSAVSIPFRVEREALKPFLSALVRSWKGTDPTVDDLGWINRMTEDLSRGTFWLTVDRSTREPLVLRAAWPRLNDRGVETLRLRIRLDLEGRNVPVEIGLPTHGIDVTAAVYPPTDPSLPRAGTRIGGTLPTSGSGTSTGLRAGTLETPTRRLIDEQRTDLFNTYIEDLRRSRNDY